MLSILARRFPLDAQERFAREAATQDRLRLLSAGGWTSPPIRSARAWARTIAASRRATTSSYFSGAFFGVLHEAGHGIYDQGLRTDWYGLPPGEAVSLGIHESQSRMWENLVGRSRAFWQYFYPAARKAFPEALADVSLDEFYFAINDVRPR